MPPWNRLWIQMGPSSSGSESSKDSTSKFSVSWGGTQHPKLSMYWKDLESTSKHISNRKLLSKSSIFINPHHVLQVENSLSAVSLASSSTGSSCIGGTCDSNTSWPSTKIPVIRCWRLSMSSCLFGLLQSESGQTPAPLGSCQQHPAIRHHHTWNQGHAQSLNISVPHLAFQGASRHDVEHALQWCRSPEFFCLLIFKQKSQLNVMDLFLIKNFINIAWQKDPLLAIHVWETNSPGSSNSPPSQSPTELHLKLQLGIVQLSVGICWKDFSTWLLLGQCTGFNQWPVAMQLFGKWGLIIAIESN